MTETNLIKNPSLFYDSLADEYDEMTDMEDRFEKEKVKFQEIIKRYNVKTALDAGCGTGFHSILLSQLGLQVTAVDVSEQMLQKARTNAKRKGVQIETIQSQFGGLGCSVDKKFDAVFCLGNSLAHLLSEIEFNTALLNFKKILNPCGVLIIQMLNYENILKNKERIQNIRQVNEKIFIRFYDYLEEKIVFNILTVFTTNNRIDYSLNSVELFPWRSIQIFNCLRTAKFDKIDFYGSASLASFDIDMSKDLVVVAQ